MSDSMKKQKLDSVDHVAIAVRNIESTVAWYKANFSCIVDYQDDTWAFLIFENVKVALVVPDQHPPHVAFVSLNAESYGKLKTHRDGTRSIYVRDPDGNSVEVMDKDSMPQTPGGLCNSP